MLLFSILFGFAIMGLGERGHTHPRFIDDAAHAVFGVISIVMKAAPIGAFGAMAFTIGKFGTGAILNLMGLIATFYLTAALFVFVVLGIIARMVGFSIFKFLAYIKDELLIVLGSFEDLIGQEAHGAHPEERLRHRAASPTPSCSPACAGSARPPPRACWPGR